MLKILELFDLGKTRAGGYLSRFLYPFEAISGIKELIREVGAHLPADAYTEVKKNVWVAKNARVAPSAHLGEYTVIGENTDVRHCAFVRGSALIGDG